MLPLVSFAHSSLSPLGIAGLTHEITIVLGQGRQGIYVEDRSIRVLAAEIPSEYLLPRRVEYTRVYTTVYPRVHNCIHACTQVRSKYLLCRSRLYVCFLGIIRRIFSDGLRPLEYEIIPSKIQGQECANESMRRLSGIGLVRLLSEYKYALTPLFGRETCSSESSVTTHTGFPKRPSISP